MARFFAVLLITSGIVSAIVHPLPNLTDMTSSERVMITLTCVVCGMVIWVLPWDRWPRSALLVIPPIGLLVKTWANLHGGLGPYSYSIHFVLIYTWMGIALPRGTPLKFSPILAFAYAAPLLTRGDPRQVASVAMVVPICILIGESVAWVSSRLRAVEQVDGLRMQWTEWLVQASVDLAHELEEGSLAERIAGLARMLPGTNGAVVLLLAPGGVLEVKGSCDWTQPLPDRFTIAESPALLEAIDASEYLDGSSPNCVALARQLGVPRLGIARLDGSSQCVGLVALASSSVPAPVDAFTRNLVRTLLVQAGLAVERTRDREALREATLHDELTKLGNRRKANARIESLVPGDSLMMIDLDYFKRVNDEHGHAKGDETLKELAAFFDRTLRTGDTAYRLGGEEFLVVLDQSGEGAEVAGMRLCGGWRLCDPITTFSAGIAIHCEEETPERTLARADAALYDAKEAGRDRVMMSAGRR